MPAINKFKPLDWNEDVKAEELIAKAEIRVNDIVIMRFDIRESVNNQYVLTAWMCGLAIGSYFENNIGALKNIANQIYNERCTSLLDILINLSMV